jgi:predicted metallopeptidase
MSEKVYERVTEAEEIIKKLCEKYPDVLWAVRPNTVVALGVSNKERPKSSDKLAVIKPIKGSFKSLVQIYNIEARYIVELYYSDWNAWSEAQRVAVMFHELLHVASELGKTVKHDLIDFKVMIDKLGVDWIKNSSLPNLLNTKIDFNLALRPNVPEDGNLEVDTGDEIVDDKEDKKSKKDK